MIILDCRRALYAGVAGKAVDTMRFPPILILFVLGSCSSGRDENLRIGDLTFDIRKMISFYNLPGSVIRKIESGLDTTTSDYKSDKDESFIEIFHRLKNQNLLYKPLLI